MKNKWQLMTLQFVATIDELLETIDDSLTMGFEVQVQDGLVYWRELE